MLIMEVQISLLICTVWSEYMLSAYRVIGYSLQTVSMESIWLKVTKILLTGPLNQLKQTENRGPDEQDGLNLHIFAHAQRQLLTW